MDTKRLLTGLLAFLLCSSASAALAADDLIGKIKAAGVIRLCQIESAPQNTKDPNTGQWSGLQADLGNDLAATLGVKVENVEVSWASVVQSVLTSKCDLSVASTYISPARAEQVLYTSPTTAEGQTAFVKTDSQYKTLADLDKSGVTVVAGTGTAELELARKLFKNATVKSVNWPAQSGGLIDVNNNRADAYWGSVFLPLVFLKTNPNIHVRTLGEPFYRPTPIAWILKPNEYHFQQYINIFLEDYRRSGKLKEYVVKYYGTTIE
jgi:ABC-type amino acid transport substrate-binding protein